MTNEALVEDMLALWRLLHRSSHPVRKAEITPEQYWLLRTLSRREPLRIGELAHDLGIGASAATIACKRLEDDGLLRRDRRAGDERVVLVSLTEAGRARIEAWRQRRRELLTGLLAVLSPTEQEQMQRLIGRVLDGAEARAAGGRDGTRQRSESAMEQGAQP
jgi:DNA-binding MarR family transcriptional regulator